jgi:hypothetical protein
MLIAKLLIAGTEQSVPDLLSGLMWPYTDEGFVDDDGAARIAISQDNRQNAK